MVGAPRARAGVHAHALRLPLDAFDHTAGGDIEAGREEIRQRTEAVREQHVAAIEASIIIPPPGRHLPQAAGVLVLDGAVEQQLGQLAVARGQRAPVKAGLDGCAQGLVRIRRLRPLDDRLDLRLQGLHAAGLGCTEG